MCTCYSYLVIYSNAICLFHGFYLYIFGLSEDFLTSIGHIQEILGKFNGVGSVNRSIRNKSLKIRTQLKDTVELHIEILK